MYFFFNFFFLSFSDKLSSALESVSVSVTASSQLSISEIGACRESCSVIDTDDNLDASLTGKYL